MKQQYYKIILESDFVYNDIQYIIFNSIKELKEYVKQEIHEYIRDYFTKERIKEGIERYNQEPYRYNDIYSKIKLVYKKIIQSNMYDANEKKIGKTYTIQYRNPEGERDELFTLWCERIKKRDLINYTKFKESN